VSAPAGFGAFVTSAIRFWEPARILYNLALAAAFFGFGGGVLLDAGRIAPAVMVLLFAAVANLLYCLAYPVDLAVQASAYREGYVRLGRPALFAGGLLVALGLEYLAVFAMTITPPTPAAP
jgi:hypothetical protein